jgi:hypothetical protein
MRERQCVEPIVVAQEWHRRAPRNFLEFHRGTISRIAAMRLQK